jgi:Ca-activated chloride channel family protein
MAKKDGIRVYGVAFGTPNGTVSFGYGQFENLVPVPPDPATIHMIAQVTGGRYYDAQSASRVSDVYRSLGSSIGRSQKSVQITSWFAAAAAFLLIGAVVAGRLVEAPVP